MLQRQYVDSPPWKLSNALRRAMLYYLDLQQMNLQRIIRLFPHRDKPLAIASDGRLDDQRPPSVATLIGDIEQGIKIAFLAYIPEKLMTCWQSITDHYIALVEQAAIIMAVVIILTYLLDSQNL